MPNALNESRLILAPGSREKPAVDGPLSSGISTRHTSAELCTTVVVQYIGDYTQAPSDVEIESRPVASIDVTATPKGVTARHLRARLTAAGIEVSSYEWTVTLKAFASVLPLVERLQVELEATDEPPGLNLTPGAAR